MVRDKGVGGFVLENIEQNRVIGSQRRRSNIWLYRPDLPIENRMFKKCRFALMDSKGQLLDSAHMMEFSISV